MSGARKTIKSYKTRLANAERLVKSESFVNLLEHVNDATYDFILSQVRNQKLSPRARRYTIDQEIMASSVFKASGRGYRLLAKLFALPSAKTLTNLLHRIPLKPGVNKHIFDCLQNSVSKMKRKQDKVCILLFDEISIEPSVHFQRKENIIVGLQDFGDERHRLFADHANVFMLRGLYKQWKQPIAFTFSDGPVKSDKLSLMIKDIIKECQRIGLDIVATVCDQGAANQAAINKLLKETNQKMIREATENRYFGFLVEDKEVVPLFDVPHLFKGLRNNLLTKDLHFTCNDANKIAKWEHIELFYKLDTLEPTLRLCNKLTDRHVIKEKINKMKVSHCTQIFSHTVGALMKRISQWGEFSISVYV